MTFTINTDKLNNSPDYSLEKTNANLIGISHEAVDALTGSRNNLSTEASKFNLVALDSNIQSKIENGNIEDLANKASAILDTTDQSILEKLGFDLIAGGANYQIRDFFEDFGPNEGNSLAEMAGRLEGGTRHNGSTKEDWQQDGQPQTTSVGNVTQTRTKETNKNAVGSHTRTTVVTKTTVHTEQQGEAKQYPWGSSADNEIRENEVTTTVVEEYQESAPDSAGKKSYTVKQSSAQTQSTQKDVVHTDTYEEAGIVDANGNRTTLVSHRSSNHKVGGRVSPQRTHGYTTTSTDPEGDKPLFPIGKINPNPEEDGAYGDSGYEIDHPALDLHKNGFLQNWDPSVDYGEEQYASGPYTGPALNGLFGSNVGTSTGTWEVQGGPYNGPTLNGIIDSMGGTSTGVDWL